MKKILLALAIFTSVQVADAQVKSAADAKKAVEAAEANCSFDDMSEVVCYLRDPADYAVVNQLFEEKFGGNAGRKATPFILVNAPVCRPGWLIEMECMATKAISSDYPKF